MKRPLWIFAWILVACVGCDHASKQVAEQWLAGSGGVSLAGGIVQLQLVANPGAFLSLGADWPEALRHGVLIGTVPLMLGLLGWFVLRSAHVSPEQLIAFGLIAGGGLSNWLDRVMDDGAVTDFVSLGFGGLRTGIFNFADLTIVLGLLLFLRAGATPAPGAGSE